MNYTQTRNGKINNITRIDTCINTCMNKMHSRNNHRTAFTLVELSIVLVIIALIIGAVLTGQQVIQSARITNAANAIQAYQAQFQTYAQNFGTLAGDDAGATTRFPNLLQNLGVTTGGNGNGDGSIGTNNSFNTNTITGEAGESRLVWAHMRAAGLIKNQAANGTIALQPANPFSGIYGFQNGGLNGTFSTTTLCLNRVPGSAAQAIDSRLDDGASKSGSMQSTLDANGSNGTVSAQYSDAETYIICTRI